ncbi:MAG: hypothetical protein RUDDFDWM_001272 [Candidatus Fervidibacterota bacterium]
MRCEAIFVVCNAHMAFKVMAIDPDKRIEETRTCFEEASY